MEAGEVVLGGNLESEEMTFSAEFDELEPENDNFEFLSDMPSATATVRSGKNLNFGAAPKVAYNKYKEDGETWYELDGLDDDSKPNLSDLKLTYTSKTGAFTGSFKIYATNEDSIAEGKKPTLKKYTVNVTGFVVDGEGVGQAALKKPAATWSVWVMEE